jgi:hypothetical protein
MSAVDRPAQITRQNLGCYHAASGRLNLRENESKLGEPPERAGEDQLYFVMPGRQREKWNLKQATSYRI